MVDLIRNHSTLSFLSENGMLKQTSMLNNYDHNDGFGDVGIVSSFSDNFPPRSSYAEQINKHVMDTIVESIKGKGRVADMVGKSFDFVELLHNSDVAEPYGFYVLGERYTSYNHYSIRYLHVSSDLWQGIYQNLYRNGNLLTPSNFYPHSMDKLEKGYIYLIATSGFRGYMEEVEIVLNRELEDGTVVGLIDDVQYMYQYDIAKRTTTYKEFYIEAVEIASSLSPDAVDLIPLLMEHIPPNPTPDTYITNTPFTLFISDEMRVEGLSRYGYIMHNLCLSSIGAKYCYVWENVSI